MAKRYTHYLGMEVRFLSRAPNKNNMQKIEKLNIETSEEELFKLCKDLPLYGDYSSEVRTMYQNFAVNLLILKQQKRLSDDQIKSNRKLVNATWVLAGATILLVVVDLFVK